MVFAPKYRRKETDGVLKNIGGILRKGCKPKGGEIIKANACSAHIHLSARIPPYTK
ncbi:MAG: hypothetical protein HFJ80_03185 [Clostridiales bacterium]|nr:hypothetical protein [Clostridiales bacterium]